MNQEKASQITEDSKFRNYNDLHPNPLEQHFESTRLKAMNETRDLLISMRIFKTYHGILQRTVSTLILGITLLVGAILIIYFNLPQ